ncbi:MAG: Wzz/FepE/Etk N-terminal domain-containing protein [Pseudomonadota bacterium]
MTHGQNQNETGGMGSGATGYARRYRPRLGLVEVLLHLWRAKWLMLLVFLPIFGGGLYLVFKAPAKFVSKAQLLVTLDDGYLIRASVAGAPISVEDIMRVEINLLHSPDVAEQVVRRFGLERLYPDLAQEVRERSAVPSFDAAGRGIAALLDDFTVGAVPGQRLIFAEYAHGDEVLADEVLNALIGAYLGYRADIFRTETGAPFADDRQVLTARLAAIDTEISAFRSENALSDFQSERTSLNGLEGSVQTALLDVDAQLAQIAGKRAMLKRTLAATDAIIKVPKEDSAAAQRDMLRTERQDLLTRYLETSQTVAAVDQRLADLEAAAVIEAEAGDHLQDVPNPAYNVLQSSIDALEEDARALRRRRQSFQAQIDRIVTRETELVGLEPRWQDLQRRRAAIEAALNGLSAEEFGAESYIGAVGGAADTVRVVHPASIDRQDLRYRLPLFLLFLLMALVAALTAGILRALAQQGFVTARSLEQSTGVPVVSTVRRRRGAG